MFLVTVSNVPKINHFRQKSHSSGMSRLETIHERPGKTQKSDVNQPIEILPCSRHLSEWILQEKESLLKLLAVPVGFSN